jgi:hypothetical protein
VLDHFPEKDRVERASRKRERKLLIEVNTVRLNADPASSSQSLGYKVHAVGSSGLNSLFHAHRLGTIPAANVQQNSTGRRLE